MDRYIAGSAPVNSLGEYVKEGLFSSGYSLWNSLPSGLVMEKSSNAECKVFHLQSTTILTSGFTGLLNTEPSSWKKLSPLNLNCFRTATYVNLSCFWFLFYKACCAFSHVRLISLDTIVFLTLCCYIVSRHPNLWVVRDSRGLGKLLMFKRLLYFNILLEAAQSGWGNPARWAGYK